MSPAFTSPEEIELPLKETEQRKTVMNNQALNGGAIAEPQQRGWADGYISPYRAAYMKSHNIGNL